MPKKKLEEEQRKADEKNTFLMKKIEGMCNCYHVGDFFFWLPKTGLEMICCFNGVQNK